MSRPTLKVSKPVDPSAAPKPRSSRAKRAFAGKKLPPKPLAGAPVAEAAPASDLLRAPNAEPVERALAGRTAAPVAAPRPTSLEDGGRRRTRTKSGAAQREARDARSGSAPTRPPRERAPSPPPREAKPAGHRPPERRLGGGDATVVRMPKPQGPRVIRHENPDDPRLSKRMSELGLCSRREADEWIENGWVRVDGKVITTLGTRVPLKAEITVSRAAEKHQTEQVTILLNKPIGYVSGQAEHGYEPASVLIKPENRWADDPSPTQFKPGHLRGLAPAGRLDIDSTGLLVFTQDGRVAKHLVGRDSEVEKEYLVRVEGTLPKDGMRLLQHGLELDGVKLKPAKVSWQNEDQLRFVLREGRKRQIRRMCELVGLTVTGLKRVRSGGVPLGPLPVGQWRYLRQNETF
jgi:23S rRNA pseudouridine2604 synthase